MNLTKHISPHNQKNKIGNCILYKENEVCLEIVLHCDIIFLSINAFCIFAIITVIFHWFPFKTENRTTELAHIRLPCMFSFVCTMHHFILSHFPLRLSPNSGVTMTVSQLSFGNKRLYSAVTVNPHGNEHRGRRFVKAERLVSSYTQNPTKRCCRATADTDFPVTGIQWMMIQSWHY